MGLNQLWKELWRNMDYWEIFPEKNSSGDRSVVARGYRKGNEEAYFVICSYSDRYQIEETNIYSCIEVISYKNPKYQRWFKKLMRKEEKGHILYETAIKIIIQLIIKNIIC